MRFWLVLIFIFGAVYYAYAKFFGDGAETEADRQEQREEKRSFADRITGRKDSKQDAADRPERIVIKRPVATRLVRFTSRPVPAEETLSALVGRTNTGKSVQPPKNARKVETPPRPVRFAVDRETNSVLLIGDLEELLRVSVLIKELDQVVSTCHLKTWIVFVKGDRQKSYDLVARLVTGNTAPNSASLGGGIFKAALNLNNLQLSLQAGASRGMLEIVDEPYMQLIQARPSVITTGEEIAIPSTTVNQGVSQTSVEFKNVGLSLGVTPYFLDNNRVRLLVEQKNDVVGSTIEIDGNPIPEISTQSLNTSVEMRMGEVIVLGGVESAKREKRRGWLHKREERTVGHLYVVAAVYSTIPKAVPVLDVGDDFPVHPFRPQRDLAPWLGSDNLLPSLK